jgi:hypothetical protein
MHDGSFDSLKESVLIDLQHFKYSNILLLDMTEFLIDCRGRTDSYSRSMGVIIRSRIWLSEQVVLVIDCLLPESIFDDTSLILK